MRSGVNSLAVLAKLSVVFVDLIILSVGMILRLIRRDPVYLSSSALESEAEPESSLMPWYLEKAWTFAIWSLLRRSFMSCLCCR